MRKASSSRRSRWAVKRFWFPLLIFIYQRTEADQIRHFYTSFWGKISFLPIKSRILVSWHSLAQLGMTGLTGVQNGHGSRKWRSWRTIWPNWKDVDQGWKNHSILAQTEVGEGYWLLFSVTHCYSADNDRIKPKLTKVFVSIGMNGVGMGMEWGWGNWSWPRA